LVCLNCPVLLEISVALAVGAEKFNSDIAKGHNTPWVRMIK